MVDFMMVVFYIILSNQNLRFVILISFKNPVFNKVGEDFWGAGRFKAPEEYELHAQITSETNVYVLAGLLLPLLVGKMIKAMRNGRAH